MRGTWRKVAVAVLSGLLVVGATACGGEDGVQPAATTDDTATEVEPPDDAAVDEVPTDAPDDAPDDAPPSDDAPEAASPVLEDGRHPAYLVALDVSGRTVTVDVIQFLTGDEAIAAYREDTSEDPEGDPPNDYFIRNENPLLRTLPVAAEVAVTVVRLGEPSGAGSVPSTFEDLPAHLDEQPPAEGRLAWNPYWLTVEGGEVVAIDEQYLP
jgi:hypothetical protein